MKSDTVKSVDAYFESLPDERKEAMLHLRKVLRENMPEGFSEVMNYGMPSYVVPHTLYPPGYHVNPALPLPFVSIASQKNFIALYHIGVYADKSLYDWFIKEYPNYTKSKPDMGKSCIRFKKTQEIPFELIAKLMRKITADDWIRLYEHALK